MKKKPVLIIAALVLLGGAAAAWFTVIEPATTAASTEGPEQSVYYEMQPIAAPFVRDGAFTRYVTLIIDLELSSSRHLQRVRDFSPRLRDAFASDLIDLAMIRPPEERLLNIARVKVRLLASARRVLGDDVVRDVLIQLTH